MKPRLIFLFLLLCRFGFAAEPAMPDLWSNQASVDSKTGRPDTRWFEEAKFGLFIHWGLYSHLGNEWKGKSYYGSGEWIMNRAKIPAAEYAQIAREFNPTAFDAAGWARFARDAGMRYLVITAKHHEGFAMYHSKVSPFNIVDATPYGKDPMAALAEACRAEGVKFGFYYSQYLDWHEPNGGGNRWDFDESKKDVKRYYAEKSVPQIKELLTGYGPLGLVWFDMPGGLTRDETLSFMQEVRRLQPQTLISSRVGQGLGDFRDFGDSELPPNFIDGPWEALFTHNDSWGFVHSDLNFKTPREIIQLLAATSARGGNLLLNVGPDGAGRMPELSVRYLREVGAWLKQNGESIYGTAHGPIPDQPWGVTTLKPGRLFLHVFTRPQDGRLIVPNVSVPVKSVHLLGASAELPAEKKEDLVITLPDVLPDARNSVVVVEFSGELRDAWKEAPAVVSRQFDSFLLDAAQVRTVGRAEIKTQTHSRYFGNWKHDTCVVNLLSPSDRAEYTVRFVEPGHYRVTLEYACAPANKGREGWVQIGEEKLGFETLRTGDHDTHQPILFIRHVIGVARVETAGSLPVVVQPKSEGPEMMWLRRVILEPVR